MRLYSTLFSFSGELDRRSYVVVAFAGVLVKHVLDIWLAGIFHHTWSPLNYLMPLGLQVSIGHLSRSDQNFLGAMTAISVPFAWVGVAITAKRFRTIGWPPWLVVLFFVPIANIVSFAMAAAWPERESISSGNAGRWFSRFVPTDSLGAAIVALILTTIIGVAFVAIGTLVLGSYGWGLFAAIPFVQGALSVLTYGAHENRTLHASLSVAFLSVALTGLALLALAFEGAICILMALPIAIAFALIGAAFAYAIQRRTPRPGVNLAAILICALLAPAIMGAEWAGQPVAPIYVVHTSVDIDAPPDVVWRNVVSFPDLPPPTELPFRVGIAYPERARIVGRGVGAVRYCEFSTGDFIEPITVWKQAHTLAFRVAKSAEPMKEWSPYGHIDTPHLHGFMVSLRGRFDLVALPGGRTRLIGTTWYQHHLWPASYWALWSDAIVHEIHLRVLNHVKGLSERSRATAKG